MMTKGRLHSHTDKIRDAYAEGQTMAQIGDDLGVTRQAISDRLRGMPDYGDLVDQHRDHLPPTEFELQQAARHERQRTTAKTLPSVHQYTDDELIQALKDFQKTHGDPVTVPRYRELRTDVQPSDALFFHRFGSWNEAKRQAGLPTRAHRTYARRWTEDELKAWVLRYVIDTQPPFSYRAFDVYLRDKEGAPSPQTVRNQLDGPWSTILQRALDEVNSR